MVLPHFLILIYLTVVKYFQTSPLSPRAKYLNYLGQCQQIITARLHPTSLLKSCADTFSILISHLANLSFTQATFPSKFKLALISPLLKKPGLPKSDLANFRPISNLNTIGKILERLALSRIFPHIQNHPVFLRYSLLIGNFIPLRLPCSN